MSKKAFPLYRKVRTKPMRDQAWQKVRSNGLKSTSKKTRDSIKSFSYSSETELGRIYRQLQKETFKFGKSKGIPIEREGKKPRPLVVAPIKNRIVQRCILQVLQEQNFVKKFLDTPTSFGGIKGKTLDEALSTVHKTIKAGNTFFVCSDIKDFFTKIDRKSVFQIFENNISDTKFLKLLDESMQVDLENMAELKSVADIFPIYEGGVAQGCSLSSLYGNIQLANFDKEMNANGIVCLRYVDDFIVLGNSYKSVKKAFKKAKKMLSEMNMEIHDPFEDKGKGQIGNVNDGFEFLGCKITPGRIQPAGSAVNRVKKKVKTHLYEAAKSLHEPDKLSEKNLSFIDSLNFVNNLIKGWGNQYSFCNNKELMASIDAFVSEQTNKYITDLLSLHRKSNPQIQQELLGIQLLKNCKSDPIVERK